MSYIGQSRRSILVRYKEHEKSFRLNHPIQSAVVAHMLEKGHTFGLKLLKEVSNPNEWKRMNVDDIPINRLLLPKSNGLWKNL